MKSLMRILSLFLILSVLTVSMTSCLSFVRISDIIDKELESLINTSEPSDKEDTPQTSDKDSNDPSGPSEEEPDDTFEMAYTLTDADLELFESLLETCEELTLEGTNAFAIEEAWEALEQQYDHIMTQGQIAYVLYCCDVDDDSLAEDYLEASQMQGEAYNAYIALCKKIDESNSPYRDEFFSDWSEQQIAEMRLFTDEITALQQRNDSILVQSRELDVESQGDVYAELYYAFIQNQNAIAQQLGYENYYAYASENVYLRDYSAADRALLRQYVAEEIVPLCKKALESAQNAVYNLNFYEYQLYENFLANDYDTLSKDYLQLYIDSYTGEAKEIMNSLFEEGNSIFSDAEGSYEGAFQGYLTEYGRSFCYFGPSYQDITTVTHEMGHYYASHYLPQELLSIDLAEVHSQGNEWLLYAFLEDKINSDVYEALVYSQLYDVLATIIVSTLVDEFEETVYTNLENYGSGEFDTVMLRLCDNYGGRIFVESYLTDISLYWKYVAIESPVYYISYATSAVASLELYCIAQEDFDVAQEIYCSLAEDADLEKGFVGVLLSSGLSSPFKETVYQKINALFS